MIFGNVDFEIIYKKSFCPDWKKIYQSVAILFYNWQTQKKISEPTEPVEPILYRNYLWVILRNYSSFDSALTFTTSNRRDNLT